jgi:carbamoylphosphate synthase large subunit
MDTFYDKAETHKLCEELGIPMAPSARLKASDTAGELIARFGLPLVLKPRRTFFAEKDQAREVVEIADTESDVQRILGTISQHAHYIVEGFFVGEGVGVSVLAKEGKILQDFQHRRLRKARAGRVRSV